jgi:hypothetical protein
MSPATQPRAFGQRSTRGLFEAVLGAILPSDEQSRLDSLARTAYYTADLTDPPSPRSASSTPTR